ncbi:hypothetical protein NEUTE2DRAFT_157166 [Neurospora tetrasperma FGSC 2509]|nr:hypothetical protein NEUTE2DRAFT_157166 [Neurospora tetrasperma FGSC 2509]
MCSDDQQKCFDGYTWKVMRRMQWQSSLNYLSYIPPRPKVPAVCLSPTFLALGARLIVRLDTASEEAFEIDVFNAGTGLIGNEKDRLEQKSSVAVVKQTQTTALAGSPPPRSVPAARAGPTSPSRKQPHLSLAKQRPDKETKSRGGLYGPSNLLPEFWDNPSKVSLTPRALRELGRRNSTRSAPGPTAPASAPNRKASQKATDISPKTKPTSAYDHAPEQHANDKGYVPEDTSIWTAAKRLDPTIWTNSFWS